VTEFAKDSDLATAVVKAIEDKKAIDSLRIDVCGRSPVTDHFVIATGRSSRHLKAMANEVAAVAHRFHLQARIEGLQALEWVLADLGDVVVHLFLQDVRDTFQLEQLWAAPPTNEAQRGPSDEET